MISNVVYHARFQMYYIMIKCPISNVVYHDEMPDAEPDACPGAAIYIYIYIYIYIVYLHTANFQTKNL